MPRKKQNPEPYDFEALMQEMIASQLVARDIVDERVLDAFRAVPRHRFVDPIDWDEAYADHPLGIGCGQTISQPYIVALMTQLLQVEPDMSVLEVGTGSGYQTAILAAMGARVFTIERLEDLTERAANVLDDLAMDDQIEFFVGDGSIGLPERAPFDRIVVTAGAPAVPEPLVAQLADGGRLVVPAGKRGQCLHVVERHGDAVSDKKSIPVVFVPLVGEAGYAAEEPSA